MRLSEDLSMVSQVYNNSGFCQDFSGRFLLGCDYVSFDSENSLP